MSVESTPGVGSVFTIVLPRTEEAPKSISRAPRAAAEAAGADAPLVLLVDDDPQIHDLIGAMLEREGFRLEHATGGGQALDRAREIKPAVILLDVMMPQVDGWTVLGRLKADPELAAIPVVIVSLLDERPLGLSLGAAEFLNKPLDRAQLVATVRAHAGAAGGRILVVDDDADQRRNLKRTLSAQGYEVLEAAGGEQAWSWLEANPKPDVIVLDLVMGGMDGFTLLDRLRHHPTLNDIKVLVVSAKDLSSSETDFLLERGGTVIPKGPNARQALSQALKSLGASTTAQASSSPLA